MAKDLTITLEDQPGALAKVGEALGKAGMNIEGVCGTTIEGKGVIHILVEDAVAARKVLEANRIQVTDETDVLVVNVEDRPAALGNVARRLAGAGVNIHLAYLATSTRLVLGVDDVEKARSAIQPGPA